MYYSDGHIWPFRFFLRCEFFQMLKNVFLFKEKIPPNQNVNKRYPKEDFLLSATHFCFHSRPTNS